MEHIIAAKAVCFGEALKPEFKTYAEQIIKTEAYRLEKRFADGVKGLHVYGAKVTDGKQIAALLCTIA